MLRDPISVAALVAAVIINILTILLLAAKLRQVDYPVPVHYLSFVGFDEMGKWYENYRIGLFSVVVTIVNGLLAAKSFQRNRLSSFFLLLGACAVAVLALVISSAFVVIV